MRKRLANHQHQFVRKKIDAVLDLIEGDRRLIAEIMANFLVILLSSTQTIL